MMNILESIIVYWQDEALKSPSLKSHYYSFLYPIYHPLRKIRLLAEKFYYTKHRSEAFSLSP